MARDTYEKIIFDTFDQLSSLHEKFRRIKDVAHRLESNMDKRDEYIRGVVLLQICYI